MERIGSGPPAVPAAPATTGAPTAAAPVLTPGATVDVRVLQALAAGSFLVALDGKPLVARSDVPLRPGSTVRLQVAAAQADGLVLRLAAPISTSLSDAPQRLAAVGLPATPAAIAVLDAFEDAGAPLLPQRLQAALGDSSAAQAPPGTAQAHALLAARGLPATPALLRLAQRATEPELPRLGAALRDLAAARSVPGTAAPPAASRQPAAATVPVGMPATPPSPAASQTAPAAASAASPLGPPAGGPPLLPPVPNAHPIQASPAATPAPHAAIIPQPSGMPDRPPAATPRIGTDAPAAPAMPAASVVRPGPALAADRPAVMMPANRPAQAPTMLPPATVPATPEAASASTATPRAPAARPAAAAAVPDVPPGTPPAASPRMATTSTQVHVPTPPAPRPVPPIAMAAPATSALQPAATPATATPATATPATATPAATLAARPAGVPSTSASPPTAPPLPAAAPVPGSASASASGGPHATQPAPQPGGLDLPDPVRDGATAVLRAFALAGLRPAAISLPGAVRNDASPIPIQPADEPPAAQRIAAALADAVPRPATADVPMRSDNAPTQPAPAVPEPEQLAIRAMREHLAEQVFKPKDLADYDRVVALPLAAQDVPTPARLAVARRSTGSGAQATFVRIDAELSSLGAVSIRLSGADAGGPLAITLAASPATGRLLAEELPGLVEDLRALGLDAGVRVVADG